MKCWENGAADCCQAIMTRDAPLVEFAREAGLSQGEAVLVETHVAEETDSMCLFPEVPQTLQALRRHGLNIAVLSISPSPTVRQFLRGRRTQAQGPYLSV